MAAGRHLQFGSENEEKNLESGDRSGEPYCFPLNHHLALYSFSDDPCILYDGDSRDTGIAPRNGPTNSTRPIVVYRLLVALA